MAAAVASAISVAAAVARGMTNTASYPPYAVMMLVEPFSDHSMRAFELENTF